MSLEARKAALLALVDDDLRRQTQALLDAADAQAATLRRQAHAQARQRVREALDAARERRDAALAAAEARRQTRERLARQHRDSAALAAAWQALPLELQRRWRDPAARAAWLAHALGRAARELGGERDQWVVRHADGVAAAELAPATGGSPTIMADPALRAGLRIARGGNVLDASLDGLLGDRAAVSAALLQRLGGGP
jgi:hypothetical protein